MKQIIVLNICGVKVPVIEKRMRKYDGLYDTEKQIIYIHPRLTDFNYRIKLLHEILHAIIDIRAMNMIRNVRKLECEEEAEEAIVVPISVALIDLFTENLELVDMLFSKEE